MVTVLEPILSREIQAAIDNADLAAFKKLMDENEVDASSFLHASSRKIAHPLINRALSREFTNKNFVDRLEIARFLLDKGADPNMTAPNGMSAMAHLLHVHQFLGATKRVDHDVYLFTMLFTSELVIRYNADLNIALRSQYTLLDEVICQYQIYNERSISQMDKVTFEIIDRMLKRGARWTRTSDHSKFKELTGLMLKHRNSRTGYIAPELPEPPFDTLFDRDDAAKLWEAWNQKESGAYSCLQAVRRLHYRAYYHANWSFDQDDVNAIKTLTGSFNGLEKDKRKAALSDLKKLSVPQKNLWDLKSEYEKGLFIKNKEILPMKPVYDDAVYQRLYLACLLN
ncbi:hypothetical protein [Flavobacterium sp.]|uniref:hypothetical protein n=3 Tax=Flavobacterium sp. TaxID=239 RepID=UPI0040336218